MGRSHVVDLTGQRFGSLVAIEPTDRRRGSHIVWKCQCDCGKATYVATGDLKRHDGKNTVSCGCASIIDLTGQRFGRLFVLSYAYTKNHTVRWNVRCDCGTEKVVDGGHLKSGAIRSCGCLLKETISSINSKKIGPLHPNWNLNLTDEEREQGRSYPEYSEWRKAVFERDNFICQKCGSKVDLNAHHIEAFADNRELRTELSNGVTLCKACHGNFHHNYGYHSTRAKFNEWMEQ